jgi:hypothetical protein
MIDLNVRHYRPRPGMTVMEQITDPEAELLEILMIKVSL